MNKTTLKILSAVATISLFSLGCPQVLAAGDEKLISELLQKSGATQQISMLPDVIKVMIPIQMAMYGAGEGVSAAAGEKISTEFFVGEDILDNVSRELVKDFNRKHAEKYMKWLDTALGKKITELEVNASSPEAALAVLAYSVKLQQQPPSDERIALVARLIEVLNAVEHAGERSGIIMIKVSRGINSSLPKDRRTPDDVLEKVGDIYKKVSAGQMESFIMPTFLYTYESLSDEELGKYVDFLDTREARWFNQILLDAQLAAIENDCEKFGQALGKDIAKLEPPEKVKFEWKIYSPPAGDFSIEFPAEVEPQQAEIPTEDGGFITMNIISSEINGLAFMMSYMDNYLQLMQEEIDVDDMLISAADGSAANTGGTIIEGEYIDSDGFPGLDFKVSIMGGSGLIRSRIYLAHGNFYQIMIIGTIRDTLNEENNRFLDSFKINN